MNMKCKSIMFSYKCTSFFQKKQKKKKQVKQTQMSVSKVEMTRHDDEWDLAIFLESKVIKGKGACERECDDV